MIISILVDDPESWFVEYAIKLQTRLVSLGHTVTFHLYAEDVIESDVCFLLSCTKIVKESILDLNKHNIVVHASDLPKGKGFTPLKWQILEGKNIIPLTLFEAIEECDAGPYYIKDSIKFAGYEMLNEMQNIMALKIIDMCMMFVEQFDSLKPIKQCGNSTYYGKFKKVDDILDVDSTIRQLFNRFRIADYDRFPLTFNMLGHKYSIKVERID